MAHNTEDKKLPFESTQKDIRDAIEAVADNLGHITGRTASDVVYDNTASGLTADDVQEAIDQLSAEKIDKSGVDIKTNTSGQFDTVTGGKLLSCILAFTPKQSGSGTPSPSNVRPITGHTSGEVLRTGKNLLSRPYTYEITGQTSRGGVNYQINNDGSLTLTGKRTSGQSATYLFLDNAQTPNALNHLIGVPIIMRGTVSNICNVQFWTANGNKTIASDTVFTLTAEDLATTWNVAGAVQYTDSNLNNTVYPMICLATETDTTYKPYQPKQDITIQFGGTYYGGTYDFVSGVLTDEWVNIASYNGEAITEPWLSSMDAYTSGATPTTGAQVVYKKATATRVQLTPSQINTLVGQNNLSAPLDGQSIQSAVYRELFVWDDVEDVVELRLPISAIGTDESNNDTASQAYSQGDYFYKNGIAKAKTSIASGATFTLGTNYEIKTLAEILQTIESQL